MIYTIKQWLHQRKLKKRRKQVIDAMAKYPEGATLRTIASESGFDISWF